MIYALHGFLGKPSDWDFLGEVQAENLYEYLPCSLGEAAGVFCEKVSGKDNVLVGYSLGGRLALHILLHSPEKFSRAFIVSANPGIDEKEARLKNDEAWAERFLNDSWENVISDWNSQPVFQGATDIERVESDYDREKLAFMLREWSVAKQENLWLRLNEIEVPIKWVVGKNDEKYLEMSKKVPFEVKALDCGHRVPWEVSAEFKSLLEEEF